MNRSRDEKVLKKFGAHLKHLRESKELSLRKLADLADVDFSQIHRIEKGETNPSLTMLLSLAEALDVTVAEILEFK